MVIRQRGMTLISAIVLLIMVGILVLAAARLVPIYIRAFNIGASLDAIRSEATTQTIPRLHTDLNNQLMINGLSNLRAADFRFIRHGNELTISISRQLRGGFIANLDFMLLYHHSITVTRNQNGNE